MKLNQGDHAQPFHWRINPRRPADNFRHGEIRCLGLLKTALRAIRRYNSALFVYRIQIEGNVMAECPVCGAEVELAADAVVGELMECEDCGTELEVLEIEPPELGEAPESEEDWGQ